MSHFQSYTSFRSKALSIHTHLSLLVKPQDIIAHTAGPATLHLMLVSEKFLAGKAPAVV